MKRFYITGDTHGDFTRLFRFYNRQLDSPPEEIAFIILGDCGFNSGIIKRDNRVKEDINSLGYSIYCVRGNHEMRPENVEGMKRIWDSNVQANVWYEPTYPLIRYFDNYGIYYLKTEDKEYRTLVIGGAYSIDKYYRLKNNLLWWEDEQLTDTEKSEVERLIRQTNKHFDLVLSHTCPYSLRPVDKFLSVVDQSTVDTSMEEWLETIKNMITYDVWLSGHHHVDRFVNKHNILYFNCIDPLEDIFLWHDKMDDTVNNIDRY